MGGGLLLFHARSSPANLLATAYREQRTFDLRVARTVYSPVRTQRGQALSRVERPQSLLEAEAAISRGLRTNPQDGSLLAARGLADIQEWSYEAAITDMQEALDSAPKSTTILNGLAIGYFERAESEGRYEDYGTAFEIQSRALQISPDDTILLFNRAITAARMYLLKQSIEDWRHYLTLDPVGQWADEAKQRLDEVRSTLVSHNTRTNEQLLTPAEVAQTVDPSDQKTWDRVDARIEDYLSRAITDWLPAAFPNPTVPASSESERALWDLAIILETKHNDRWLRDLLSTSHSAPFALAVASLSRAVNANNVHQDYTLGRQESIRAAQLFSQAHSFPGVMRAEFEEIYSQHFADATSKCLAKIHEFAPQASARQYRWLQIQMLLEKSVCLGMTGDLGDASDLTGTAYRQAVAVDYATLALRGQGFWAANLGEKGQKRQAWNLCKEGLRHYWAGSMSAVPGYNLYLFVAQLAEEREPWFLETAIDEQAISILPEGAYPEWAAFEHLNLAKSAAKAGLRDVANKSLLASSQLLASLPNTEITENLSLGAEIETAELYGKAESAQVVLNRLQSMSPRVGKISNVYVVGDYFTAIGRLQGSNGELRDSESALEKAVAVMEHQRASLHSDDDRDTWYHESVGSYRTLAEVKLRLGDALGALAVWELYRDSGLRRLDRSSSFDASNLDPQMRELRGDIADEFDGLNRLLLTLGKSKALVYISAPGGILLLRYGRDGSRGWLIDKDPAYVRMLALRLSELCATPTSSASAIHDIGRKLYDILVAPVAEELEPGQPLIIEQDWAATTIPFQVLLDPNGHYLTDQHPITYSIGLRYLATSEPNWISENGTHTLVVASATAGRDSGLWPLSDVVAEAHDVGRLLPGANLLLEDQASLPNVMSQLSNASIFHFAGHAGIVGGHMGLLLSSSTGGRNTTVLDSTLVQGAALPHLKIAVLSACSTERGTDGTVLAPGSLARAFLRVGVTHVVGTRWNVDSATSRMLVQGFYRALLSGQPVSRALVTAEDRLRQSAPHPYYWASFEALGNP